MKRYMLLHIGFKQPTPELMARWKAWFEGAATQTVEKVGLRSAREITRDGVKDSAVGRRLAHGLYDDHRRQSRCC